MADIEDDAAPARLEHLLADPPVGRHRRVGKRPEAMGDDVAPAQPRQHLEPRRRRVVEMRHHRQPDLLGDLERHVERGDPGSAAGAAADPHLDPDDQVAVGVDDAHAFARIDAAADRRASPTMTVAANAKIPGNDTLR